MCILRSLVISLDFHSSLSSPFLIDDPYSFIFYSRLATLLSNWPPYFIAFSFSLITFFLLSFSTISIHSITSRFVYSDYAFQCSHFTNLSYPCKNFNADLVNSVPFSQIAFRQLFVKSSVPLSSPWDFHIWSRFLNKVLLIQVIIPKPSLCRWMILI